MLQVLLAQHQLLAGLVPVGHIVVVVHGLHVPGVHVSAPVQALLQHIVHAEGLLQQGAAPTAKPHELLVPHEGVGHDHVTPDAGGPLDHWPLVRPRCDAPGAGRPDHSRHPGHHKLVVRRDGFRGAEEILAELASRHLTVHIEVLIVLHRAQGGQRGHAVSHRGHSVSMDRGKGLADLNRRFLVLISRFLAAKPSRQTVHHFRIQVTTLWKTEEKSQVTLYTFTAF